VPGVVSGLSRDDVHLVHRREPRPVPPIGVRVSVRVRVSGRVSVRVRVSGRVTVTVKAKVARASRNAARESRVRRYGWC